MAKRGSNIYKRKDGRFEGRVPVGYHDNGKIKATPHNCQTSKNMI